MEPEIDIKTVKDDELNRNQFAEKLANSIIKYGSSEPLTIGIMGSWGSGKSSLINLTENILKKENIITIRFNPWYFSKQDNLYLQFFKLLFTTLKNNEINSKNLFERKTQVKRTMFKNTNNSIINYFNYLKDSSIELNIENLHYPLDLNNLESYDLLQFHKKECEDYFEKIANRIIVIIDDIDRLTNQEIAQIFTLVKSLADFKNFIYILSFDKIIVTEAINNIISGDKNKFIDKIIQIPISIPKISETKMDELILEDIGKIHDNINSKANLNNDFGEIFDYLKLFIKDIRDLKRYKNSLKFYLNNFLEELNLNDFFLILAIHLFEYELFLNINKQKDSLIIKKEEFNNESHKMISTKNDSYKKIFENEKWDYLKNVLLFLFPKLTPSRTKISLQNYEQWETLQRICSEKYFEKYFTLSLENYEISQMSLNKLMEMNDIEEISEFVTQNTNLSYNHSLLSEFRKSIQKTPPKNPEIFIKGLMKSSDAIKINPSSRKYFKWIFNELFNQIESTEKCYEILEECIENYYKKNLFTITEYIHTLSIDYGLIGHNENIKTENEMFIQKSQLKNLIKLTVNKIHENSENKEEFLNQKYLKNMLNYWERLENHHSVKSYILENVNTHKEILSFLSKYQKEDSENKLTIDFKTLNTFHGLKFYENEINEILSDKDLDEKTKNFCELYNNQLNEYKQRTQPLFITYCWNSRNTYKVLKNWINNSEINWKDMSMTSSDPDNSGYDIDLEKLIGNNIKNSSLFIIIAEMCKTQKNRNWIKKEVKLAQKYNKPILVINTGKNEIPFEIQQISNKQIPWDKNIILNEIRDILGI